MKTKRIAPGFYEVSRGEYVVDISRCEEPEHKYGQWIVTPRWNRSGYSDPIVYVKDAKRYAKQIIDRAIMDELKRVIESNKRRMEVLET